jgi:hypothetical protein
LSIDKGSAESRDSDEKLEAALRWIEERLGTLPSTSDHTERRDIPASYRSRVTAQRTASVCSDRQPPYRYRTTSETGGVPFQRVHQCSEVGVYVRTRRSRAELT